ncbi:MAG: tRNA (cytidine(34)-2'-O)-methyltransferase [Bilifractor sp.]|nr:tRNA (cytidine(34)-2'-O)-methyltransferase [Lachnospiraceae bacterium]MDY2837945.1 tRNA (cytidine(34)-2'-O)-methyltransferase [Bilifractor sp.]
MAHFNIVLHEPEIPSNTGNIGRTCVAAGASLHLIEPLGFHLSEKSIKRAGMDYWDKLDVARYIDYEDFLEQHPGAKIYYASTKGPRCYTDVTYEDDCFIMFGKESAGIPEEILYDNQATTIRIPMLDTIRSLNLANSVSIVLYEALRQHNFEGMLEEGKLRNYTWRT